MQELIPLAEGDWMRTLRIFCAERGPGLFSPLPDYED
jgi:hypothetical protein